MVHISFIIVIFSMASPNQKWNIIPLFYLTKTKKKIEYSPYIFISFSFFLVANTGPGILMIVKYIDPGQSGPRKKQILLY